MAVPGARDQENRIIKGMRLRFSTEQSGGTVIQIETFEALPVPNQNPRRYYESSCHTPRNQPFMTFKGRSKLQNCSPSKILRDPTVIFCHICSSCSLKQVVTWQMTPKQEGNKMKPGSKHTSCNLLCHRFHMITSLQAGC